MSPESRVTRALRPHPDFPPHPAWAVTAGAWFLGEEDIRLVYRVQAPPETLRVPPPRTAVRTDGLWKHTCFECFAALGESPAYREFNFSPSGAWAAYDFGAYREGGAPAGIAPPVIEMLPEAGGFVIEVRLSRASFPAGAAGPEGRIALTAVLEAADGTLSYWALAHAPGRPDFHHRAGFVLRPGGVTAAEAAGESRS